MSASSASTPNVTIRPAAMTDMPEVQAIYAHHVLHGTGTFEDVPPSVEEMSERFRWVGGRGWSWVVATDATGVLGYGYYVQFRDRGAYRYSCENSVYVREDVRGQGVGKAVVQSLIADATAKGFRQMIAIIGDSANVGSIGVPRQRRFSSRRGVAVRGLEIRWLARCRVHATRARNGRCRRATAGDGHATLKRAAQTGSSVSAASIVARPSSVAATRDHPAEEGDHSPWRAP